MCGGGRKERKKKSKERKEEEISRIGQIIMKEKGIYADEEANVVEFVTKCGLIV